jgi:hypothetical protein
MTYRRKMVVFFVSTILVTNLLSVGMSLFCLNRTVHPVNIETHGDPMPSFLETPNGVSIENIGNLLKVASKEKFTKLTFVSDDYVIFFNTRCVIKVDHTNANRSVIRLTCHDKEQDKFERLRDWLPKDDWEVLSIIQRFPTIDQDYNPSNAWAVATEVNKLGKQQAKLGLSKYLKYALELDERNELDSYKVLFICRILFHGRYSTEKLPRAPFGSLMVKLSTPQMNADFPFVFIGETPLLLASAFDYSAGHLARFRMAKETIDYCFNECELATIPDALDPTKTGKKLEEFISTPAYRSLFEARPVRFMEATAAFLRGQVRKMDTPKKDSEILPPKKEVRD